MHKDTRKDSGFTLTELAIVIVLAMLLISISITTAVSRIEVQRIKTTQERMDFLINVIDQYVRTYNHLPCPANPTLASTNSTFGIGSGTGTGTCSSTGLLPTTVGANNILVGGVPTATLGIPGLMSFDGWDSRITYVVDEDLTFEGSEGAGGFADSSVSGNIIMQNNDATPDVITNNGAVLIISHGANMFGSWPPAGGVRFNETGGSAAEDENTDEELDDIFIDIRTTSDFDDIVIYRTKWQLAR